MRPVLLALCLSLAAGATVATAQPAPAAATNVAYTTSTTDLGTLLDDAAAKAVLAKHVPQMLQSDQIEMARAMTLKDLQQYAPDMVTDDTLAKIDADLAKLPAKK